MNAETPHDQKVPIPLGPLLSLGELLRPQQHGSLALCYPFAALPVCSLV